MLIQFSVKNYRSFKDVAVLSMTPSSDVQKNENVSELENGERVLNTIAIYGANASGKTNLLKAFTTAILLVKRSNLLQVDEKLNEIVPFIFDEETAKEPSIFEFIFISNAKKYLYGFSATQTEIVNEYLYEYLTSKPSKIFERQNEVYTFTQAMNKQLRPIVNRNTKNKLFLASATAWNNTITEPAYKWFSDSINTFTDYEALPNLAFSRFEGSECKDNMEFALNLLKSSDINIDEFTIESSEMSDEELTQLFGPFLPLIKKSGNMAGQKKTVNMKHRVEDEEGNIRTYLLNLNEESRGTANIFYLAPVLCQALKCGETLIIDEIERSLHPILVEKLVALFNDPLINKQHAQLIFNTHNINLLSLDIFRRDQIYFVEKDAKKGSSELYSLDEFSVRKNENIQKGYMLGRFGGIPKVYEGLL